MDLTSFYQVICQLKSINFPTGFIISWLVTTDLAHCSLKAHKENGPV